MRRRFEPARGLSNPHAQTVAGKLLRPPLDVPLRRERLETLRRGSRVLSGWSATRWAGTWR